jgi:hypothetical protein
MAIDQLSAANTAIKGKGILTGKWVEKAEIGSPGEYDAMSDEDLERALIERMAKLASPASQWRTSRRARLTPRTPTRRQS